MTLEWTKQKPNFECIFVARTNRCTLHDNWIYNLYEFYWIQEGDDPGYLAWCDSDGNELGDINELQTDEYLVIERD